MIDKTWTRVDHDPEYMTHHAGIGFATGKDCIKDDPYLDDSIVPEVQLVTPSLSGDDLTNVSGCTIDSNHNHSNTLVTPFLSYKYRDYNLTLKPYQFDVSNLTPSIAFSSNSDFDGNSTFVYMSNLQRTYDNNNSTNDYMAIKFIGSLSAVGFDNVVLSNYVDGCFAEDINISAFSTILAEPDNSDADAANDLNLTRYIRITDSSNTIDWQRVDDAEVTASQNDLIPSTYFYKDMNGSITLGYFINYNRQVITPAGGIPFMSVNNPAVRVYEDLNVTCNNTVGNRCSRFADFTYSDYNGTQTLNDTQVNFFYARAYAPRTITEGNVANAPVGYEVYCAQCANDATLAALLNNVPAMQMSTYGVGWYNALDHNISRDGNFTNLIEFGGRGSVIGTVDETQYTQSIQPTTETYNDSSTKAYPYKTTMLYTPHDWLVYDKYNVNATTNYFDVEFRGGSGGWTGYGADLAGKTDSNASSKTARRIRW